MLSYSYHRSPTSSPFKNGATAVQTSTGRPTSKPVMSLPTSESSPFSNHSPLTVTVVKWSRSSAQNMNRVDGPWTVLPRRTHPSSMAPRSPLPTGMPHPRSTPRPRRSWTRCHPPAILRMPPPRACPHPAPPRPPCTPPLPFAKTPPTCTLNPGNSSLPPSLDASRYPLHRANLSLSSNNRSPNSNHHHSNRNPRTTSFPSTSTHPPCPSLTRRHSRPQKTSNRTFSPSFQRRRHQQRPHKRSSPRTHLVSSRPRRRVGTRLVSTPPRRHSPKYRVKSNSRPV